MDVLVEVGGDGLRGRPSEEAWDRLKPGDFEIFAASVSRQVVALELPGIPGDVAAEPWRIVLYFDAALSTSRTSRWAAGSLAARAGELCALGSVEIVVAAPSPAIALPPTRDADLLDRTLSQLALSLGGQDRLVAFRHRLLAELSQDTEATSDELLRAAVNEELGLVRGQIDELLLLLTLEPPPARAAAGATPGEETVAGVGGRRAVFLASGGFDMEPSGFYWPHLHRSSATGAEPAPPPPDVPSLDPEAQDLARVLAAYGWVVVALVPPEPPPRPRGFRLGKWLITGLVITREEDRDPERAEAYIELGGALRRQEKLEDALDAYRKAIHHFAEDPRTADRQALAFVAMGEIFEQQGDADAARQAFSRAAELDPEQASFHVGWTARLSDPLAPLEAAAEASSGWLVRDDDGLSRALKSLQRRLQLTYQVAGLPDGKLRPLEVRSRRPGLRLRFPAWTRSSTPAAVAAARLRALLDGTGDAGDLAIDARFRSATPAPDGHSGEIEARTDLTALPRESDGSPDAMLRVSVATGGPEILTAVRHEEPVRQPLESQEPWIYRSEVTLPEDCIWIAVLVEDLASGRWGADLLDLDAEAADPCGASDDPRSWSLHAVLGALAGPLSQLN